MQSNLAGNDNMFSPDIIDLCMCVMFRMALFLDLDKINTYKGECSAIRHKSDALNV